MTVHWVDQLSDDELAARLEQAGVHGTYAQQLVDCRDRDTVHEVIVDVLEAGE